MTFFIACGVFIAFTIIFLAFALSPAVLDRGEEGYDDGE
jgi:hypothetical protein